MKLFLSPKLEDFTPDSGVGQVLAAQYKHLPSYGIEFVSNPAEADIVAAHIWSNLPAVDVVHNHGLLWTGDNKGQGYTNSDHESNRAILETIKRAWAITVPSAWVAEPFKRDMRLSPTVIGHGLELADWKPAPLAERKDFILWNKNRVDAACDPTAAIELARRGLPVISTFGEPSIMQVTGPLVHREMKEIIQHAGVYLSTAKETFGIGILEALASGVPVLGYATGGILDLVQHKKTGYLVEPGDIQGLVAGYKWLIENRADMQPAMKWSVAPYDWKKIIGKYADLYQEVLERKQKPRKVSVIITNYNYEKYLPQAINAVAEQTMPAELILVDDSSTDNSREVLAGLGRHAKVIRHTTNQGVAKSRNDGIETATGDYIICLDADDWISPDYVETLYNAMEADRSLGIAYAGLMMHFPDGQQSQGSWPPEFDFDSMARPGVPPPNVIPCAAMFRKEMYNRAGGYRQEFAPGEDTEFFLRGLSVGFNAKRVTSAPLFHYRMHEGSASRTKRYSPIDTDKPWTTNRALMPMAAPTTLPTSVRSYSDPLVSVIIPVGPGHAKYLPQALNSLLAQTFTSWEAITIFDGQGTWFTESNHAVLEPVYPFVRHEVTGVQSKGAGVARNLGVEKAKGKLLFFLDADDWLVPTALEKMVKAYAVAGGGKYIYSDWIKAEAGQPLEVMPTQDYNPEAMREKIQHAVSILIEAKQVHAVNGFDEELKSWEDWDFHLRLAASGFCGQRLAEPLLIYRTQTGTRRVQAFAQAEKLMSEIKNRYKGVTFMGCCGGNQPVQQQVQQAISRMVNQPAVDDGKIPMVYVGTAQAGFHLLGKYYVARDGLPEHENIRANPEDVNALLQTGVVQHA